MIIFIILLYRLLGIFSLNDRISRADLVKIWKSFNSETDVGVSGFFRKVYHEGNRNHSLKLSITRCQTVTQMILWCPFHQIIKFSPPWSCGEGVSGWVQERFGCIPVRQVVYILLFLFWNFWICSEFVVGFVEHTYIDVVDFL